MMKDEFLQEPEQISFSALLEAIQDEDHILAPRYLYALSDLMPEEVQALREIWPDLSTRRRQTLLEDLENLTETNYLLSYEAVFRFVMSDKNSQVRFHALRALEVFDTDDLVPDFLEILDEDDSADVRAVAAAVLGKYIYRGEIDELDQETQRRIERSLLDVVVGDDPRRVKCAALEALGYSPLDEVHERISEAYQREDEQWMASALFAMGRSLDHCWDEILLSNLYHQNPQVRAEAIRASGELNLEDALTAILEMLDDVPVVRRAAIWSASQIGGEAVEPALKALLDQPLTDDEAALIERSLQNLNFLEGI
ncbi:MAG: hypothetical protein MAG431_01369 [Chloroflexi bacterium]|nr:hypothetical protein [Chloroflexota bacterium]